MTARTLVVYAHPTPHRSRINRKMVGAARGVPGVRVQDLYETYPDFYIDVAREQRLVLDADLLVFLHPIRWYSVPSLLKEWYDVVLESGWAYGKDGNALHGKRFWLAVSTGSPAEAYRPGGLHGRYFEDFLVPFEQTAALCGMEWLPPCVFHDATYASDEAVDSHVAAFVNRLKDYANP